MSFLTPVRRATAVSATSNSASWTPSFNFGVTNGLNTAIAAGEKVTWILIVTADGSGTLSETTGGSPWGPQTAVTESGNAVTERMFIQETTTAFAAGAHPAVAISCTASEQYSAVLLAYKASAGKTIGYFGLTSSQGSSTNSNPAAVSGPTAGSQDCTIIVTRGGDSTTVATAAPTNYGNLLSIAGGGTNGASTNFADRQRAMTSSDLEDPGTFTSGNEQWVTYSLIIYEFSTAAVLTAERGQFTESGKNAATLVGRKAVAAVGTFSVAGQNAIFQKTVPIIAARGLFAFTGGSVIAHRKMQAVRGLYTYAGQNATLTLATSFVLTAAFGNITFTGRAASLLPSGGRILTAEEGVYTFWLANGVDPLLTEPTLTLLTGENELPPEIDVEFSVNYIAGDVIRVQWDDNDSFTSLRQLEHRIIQAEIDGGRHFVLDTELAALTEGPLYFRARGERGQNALQFGRKLLAASRLFTLTGGAISSNKNIVASRGLFAFTGRAVAFLKGIRMVADRGLYALAGQIALFRLGKNLAGGFGAYTVTGRAAPLLSGHRHVLERGLFTLAGQAADLRHSSHKVLVAGGTSYGLVGQPAGTIHQHRLTAVRGSFVLSGSPSLFARSYIMVADGRAFVFAGQAAALDYRQLFTAATGVFVVSGGIASFPTNANILNLRPVKHNWLDERFPKRYPSSGEGL